MNFLKRLFCKCKETRLFTKWIEISQKRNKPKETILEVLETCNICDRIRRSGYFTEEELKKYAKVS